MKASNSSIILYVHEECPAISDSVVPSSATNLQLVWIELRLRSKLVWTKTRISVKASAMFNDTVQENGPSKSDMDHTVFPLLLQPWY
ncbi:hypothetical protein QYF36_005616 [Acer negundo]|nr:hypothetical protein QYF36_005616 [Acer negundo]